MSPRIGGGQTLLTAGLVSLDFALWAVLFVVGVESLTAGGVVSPQAWLQATVLVIVGRVIVLQSRSVTAAIARCRDG
jgi:hypothetical protein